MIDLGFVAVDGEVSAETSVIDNDSTITGKQSETKSLQHSLRKEKPIKASGPLGIP